MKEKKKSRLPIILTVVFCVLYVLLAVRPLNTELKLTQEWSEDIQRTPQTASEDDILIPFKLGQTMGYFTQDGKIVSSISFPFKGTISSNYYASYSSGNTATIYYSAKTGEQHVLNVPGYPYFDGNRIFTFLPGGTSVTEYTEGGIQLWQYEGYSPITAFSASENGRIIGFADGSLVSFTKNGKQNQTLTPGGSQSQVILGAAISDDGNTIACISGQNRQRIVVARKTGDLSKIIYHDYIGDYTSRQLLVKFSSRHPVVFYDTDQGLGSVNINSSKNYMIPIDGEVIQIEESDESDFAYVLSKKDSTYTVTILEEARYIAGSFSFEADSAFIQVRGDALFVGKNNKISKVRVTRS